MTTEPIADLFNLHGKVAIVTAGALGIGKAIALRLTEAGSSVVITDINMDAANQTVKEIEAKGGKIKAVKADAGKVADAQKVIEEAISVFGHLDILVNNAGVYPPSPALNVTESIWDKIHNVNLKGVCFYSQAAAREMIKKGHGGKIINLASIESFRPWGSSAGYASSKGGVIMLTKALAEEFAPHKILVNAVAPGCIDTPGSPAFAPSGVDPQLEGLSPEVAKIRNSRKSRIPLGRVGVPDDIAKVVLFVASSAADYMTGSVLLVDGGILLLW